MLWPRLGKRKLEPDETTSSYLSSDADKPTGTMEVAAENSWAGWTKSSSSSEDASVPLDGADEPSGKRRKPGVAAVFIHAGAGYHSPNNQRNHLEACSK